MNNIQIETGLFITFEGIDGCGKSTQSSLFAQSLIQNGYKVKIVRDPGSTTVSESIRHLLLDKSHTMMSPWTELLLYEAARAQLVEESIKPALNQGDIVICDRFYDSTTAYQGFARNLDFDIITQANKIGSCGVNPNYTFYIDMKPQDALRRKKGNISHDRMESEGLEFQTNVRKGYLKIAKASPQRFIVINGYGSIDDIQNNIWKYIQDKKNIKGGPHEKR